MEPSDIELVTLAKAAQDERAFAALVRRHQARLRAFLIRLCGNPHLADDIAQETFMKAHTGLSGFKGGGSFRSWLYAIAYREFLQDARKTKAAARLEDALKENAAARKADRHEAGPLEAGMSLDLRRALAGLDAMERATILLCDAAGFSHTEAASVLSTPLGSVKTYVARARDKMRAALSAEPPTAKESSLPTPANGKHYAL
ncbi:RNA polymerase sigma factor [Hyphococcus luteus]|uniref:RNA polymerase subunit sigma-70 n=1 Tax=Hyphococcus luteus TaxID=2058213 RepID=A0A2S7K0F1_9PROT|nr:RNA polymerase sigma factor [Marinicaulis flavus]PQA85941.1 RNA polymerase subunit sigma-70 [Marinicaulis flavus]